MADIEKVIKGLENCITGFDCPPECPYLDDCNDLMKPMFVELAKDALSLLKEQEAIVRCKDCKHYLLPDGESRGQCMARAGWFPVDEDWYCADGERN